MFYKIEQLFYAVEQEIKVAIEYSKTLPSINLTTGYSKSGLNQTFE